MSIVSDVLLDWKIFVLSFGLLAFVSIINTKISILPVSCPTFIVCSVFVWFVSMCITFVGLHKLLQKSEPLEFNLQRYNAKQKTPKTKNELKPNPETVKKLTHDIDIYFISKWYTNISMHNDFTEESKLFLEEVISRLAEVQLAVSSKVLLHGSLNIYLRHLKEFRRSLKRKEKYNGSVEELYRYSHISSSSPKPKEYFLHQLTTNLLRHFINSELWNSLPCHVLVSILARRLTLHILNLTANPEIINYIIFNSIATNGIKDKYNLSEYSRICISQCDNITNFKEMPKNKGPEPKIEKDPDHNDADHAPKYVDGITAPKKQKSEELIIKNYPLPIAIPENIESYISALPKKHNHLSVQQREKRRSHLKKKIDVAEEPTEAAVIERRMISDPVKIYEPKGSRNTRTWNDSKDLALGISLGHDPLDAIQSGSENGRAVGKSIFWDAAKVEHSVEGSPPTAANILLNEVKHTTQTTMEGLKSSIKPISEATVHTLHNIKDLQESTVNNALNKIGDFQDEAAGMVEGILDFGRAGLRKGLRLTGLQDNIENAKATLNISSTVNKQPIKKVSKLARSESPEKLSSEDSMESVWMNPIQMDSPNFDGQILLEKPKKTDSKESKSKEDLQIPFISTEQPEIGTESPDPEYEDTADLATSIAKLRSLLQQRTSESSLSTPSLSPMPPDDLSQRMIEAECPSDIEEVDGVMPSFYKFCAKTATGVFDKTINTIKTALPGNIQGADQTDNAWIFIQSDQTEADILTRMKKLLTERKEYCTLDTEIDTAYEAIDSLEMFQDTGSSMLPPNLAFEDELDDFEVKFPITKALVDIMCELLADTNSPFLQEPLVKAIILILGAAIEKFVISEADDIMEYICTNLFTIPGTSDQKTLFLEMDAYVEALLTSLPVKSDVQSDQAVESQSCPIQPTYVPEKPIRTGDFIAVAWDDNWYPNMVKLTLGKTAVCKSLTLLISSLQIQRINEDVVLQIFELFAMKLIEESTQLSPPASA